MRNLVLKYTDTIESILPDVEQAMGNGDVCRILNINYLGQIHTAALALLARSESLMDTVSGRIIARHPGFRLLGVDDLGVTRTLAM